MIESTARPQEALLARAQRLSQVNNTAQKEFNGGRLLIVSAGSPTSLASHPARLIIADEVDRFPMAIRKEGDPIGLLRARQTTFARRKMVLMSSPTQGSGASRHRGAVRATRARAYAKRALLPNFPRRRSAGGMALAVPVRCRAHPAVGPRRVDAGRTADGALRDALLRRRAGGCRALACHGGRALDRHG